MSRGLGKMQRLILSSLDESKDWMGKPVSQISYGFMMLCGRYWNHIPEENDPYLVRVNGEILYLDDDTFDLSATLRFLAEKHERMEKGVHRIQVSLNFQNSFWRAAKRLIETGYLVRWGYDTNRIVVKGLRLEQMENKCVETVSTHLTKEDDLNVMGTVPQHLKKQRSNI